MSWVKDTNPVPGIRDLLNQISRNRHFRDKENLKVLEIGVGNGRNLVFIGESTGISSLKGVDLDSAALKECNKFANRKGLKVETEVLDIRDADLGFEEYDIIICSMVLPHFTLAETIKILEKIKNATKEKGLIYVSTYIDKRIQEFRPNYNILEKFYLLRMVQENKGWLALETNIFQTRVIGVDETFEAEFLIAQKP